MNVITKDSSSFIFQDHSFPNIFLFYCMRSFPFLFNINIHTIELSYSVDHLYGTVGTTSKDVFD